MPTHQPRPLSPQALTLLTGAEAQLLSGETLEAADWEELGRVSDPAELARLIASARGTPSEAVLITLTRNPDLRHQGLWDAMLIGWAQGALPLDRRTADGCLSGAPGQPRFTPNLKRLTTLIRGLNSGTHQATPEALTVWAAGLATLLGLMNRPSPARAETLIADLHTHLQFWKTRYPDDTILLSRQREVLTALFRLLGRRHFDPLWATVTSLGLQDDSGLLQSLGEQKDFAAPLAQACARLAPLNLLFREALEWSSAHRDGLHWMVRQALNDRAMSSDRAAEVACHAERERWADTEIESVPGGTPNSGSATPVSPATLRRLRRQLDRWPSRWLAEEFQDLPEPVLQALAAARPLSLAHLSLLSSGLRAALDGESQMWDAFHAHTTGGVQKT